MLYHREEYWGHVEGGGEEQVVKAKRPLVGNDDLKLEADTPNDSEGVWKDGYRHARR